MHTAAEYSESSHSALHKKNWFMAWEEKMSTMNVKVNLCHQRLKKNNACFRVMCSFNFKLHHTWISSFHLLDCPRASKWSVCTYTIFDQAQLSRARFKRHR